ncbi:putative sterigmatocystin biosynthesis P450 monooxygenase stcS [Beauveria bassiana]|nr:putative sterigmatocystin biosynthesis P450 monooxygenase stcS [Beauveria bassiana]
MAFLSVLLAALALLVTHFYLKLRHRRLKQFARLPQLPTSLVWGHLRLYSEFRSRGPIDRHPELVFKDMHDALGKPPLMFVDMWPASKPVVLLTSHELAEQMARSSSKFPFSPPKASAIKDLVHLTGQQSILTSEGQEWKRLRKTYSLAFAPAHLMSLLPCMVEKLTPTIARLTAFSQTQESFSLFNVAASLTIDVIGAVVMDEEFHAQIDCGSSPQSEIVRLFFEILQTYTSRHSQRWWTILFMEKKRRRLTRQLRPILEDLVLRKYAEYRQQISSGNKPAKPRSILALTFSAGGETEPTPEAVSNACDQLMTFFFAGHDSTGVLLSWIFYELSCCSRARACVREELDALFGKDTRPEIVQEALRSEAGPSLVRKMKYISAVVKETLRLYPPASTARILQRDGTVYRDSAEEFVPERWLDAAGAYPASAWRPFERGPRNCIGQELALLEACIVVAVLARHFDFTKVGLGALERDDEGRVMYQITAKPVDGMMMQVRYST